MPTLANRRPQSGRGQRSQTNSGQQGGHYIRAAVPQGSVRDIAVEATLRAAALGRAGIGPPELRLDAQPPPHKTLVTPADLRTKIRRARTGNLILFVVDASGSMGARKRMIAVKGAVLSLLLDAYQKRDRVGLISFRGERADLLVPPTNSVEQAERGLRRMPTGGRTPLAAALHLTDKVLTHHLQRDAALTPLLVLVTDGRANVGGQAKIDAVAQAQQAAQILYQKEIAALVLDSEQGFVRFGLSQKVAEWLGGRYLPLDRLQANAIAGPVQHWLRETST